MSCRQWYSKNADETFHQPQNTTHLSSTAAMGHSLRYRLGFDVCPTPTGVPVEMRVPGKSVDDKERNSIMSATYGG